MPELKPCPHCGSDNVECLICTINADENQDVHFHIACEGCYTSGPIADTGEIAGKLWNSLPRALRWTTEPPTVAGWYWYSMGKGHAVCLLVCADGKAKLSKDHFTDAELLGGEWAGPIPAPVEG